MGAEIATRAHIPAIERLLRSGRRVSSGLAHEDLPALVDRGMTLLFGEAGHPWGVFVIDPEPRPETLPGDAPDRAELRAVALRHGPWLEDAGANFGRALNEIAARTGSPLEVSVYAVDEWLQRLLTQATFIKTDVVIYMRRSALQEDAPAQLPALPAATLRSAELADLPALAELDAVTFIPLWHFGRSDLVELLVRGRLFLAEVTENVSGGLPRLCTGGWAAGYSSLLPSRPKESHLARLAVHPDLQGRGLGHLLLVDALNAARDLGAHVALLNTQRSNLRSQQLYRRAGFEETGLELPVYVRHLP